MTIADLIKRLEEATEGSRELDSLIGRAVVPDMQEKYEIHKDSPLAVFLVPGVLPYTSSLDAALTLVSEGWFWWVGHLDQTDRRFVATTSEHAYADSPAHRGFATTPAVSICIAALKARAGGVK